MNIYQLIARAKAMWVFHQGEDLTINDIANFVAVDYESYNTIYEALDAMELEG